MHYLLYSFTLLAFLLTCPLLASTLKTEHRKLHNSTTKAHKGDSIPTASKQWITQQMQILRIFNSMQNCDQLTKEMSSIKFNLTKNTHLFTNSTLVKSYVENGFNNLPQLFDIFWFNWENWDLIYKTVIYFLKSNITATELFYGFGSVVVNQWEFFKIPQPYDVFSQDLLGRSVDEVDVEDITKSKAKPGINYYLEDPGLRSFYVNWFLHNPVWWNNEKYGVQKNRIGELFLYVVHQLQARYNTARIAAGLKPLNKVKFKITDEAVKEVDDKLKEIAWSATSNYEKMEEPVEQVGKLILKRVDNGKHHFMELLNNANLVWKDKRETKLENWYRVLKYVDSLSLSVRERHLKPYNRSQLHFDGITLESLKISYWKHSTSKLLKENTFYTKWVTKKYTVAKCNKNSTIKRRILNHQEFSYELKIESLLDSQVYATVGIFLCPKFDFDGRAIISKEYPTYIFQMDRFNILLKQGENKFHRDSQSTPLFSKGDYTYTKGMQDLEEARTGLVSIPLHSIQQYNCEMPMNLLVPKGGDKFKTKFLLFAIISPSTGKEKFTPCGGGGKSEVAFGFPFDRAFENDNLLDDVNNAKMIEVGSVMVQDDNYEEIQ